MLIRKILVPLSGRYDRDDPEDLDSPALLAGFAAARRFDAHVEVLCVTGEPSKPDERWSAWLPGYGVREMITLIEQEGEARRRQARAAYDRVLAGLDPSPARLLAPGSGYSTRFVEQIGDIRETVGAHGRLADLIVTASARSRWEMPFRPILEACLRRTACPVLVSPRKPSATIATRIAVAWNDSVESARAVGGALGLLQAADSVLVVCCKESGAASPVPDKLLDYLAWHGIEARSVELAKRPKQAAAAIVAEALGAGCDLVVLGAYIHARAHALMFGSMTEYVLRDPKLPALLVP